ncbi:MAG: hypothetical protein HYZ42_06235 [Bacteroidetes bacterium]|nr:hypothetical protein [Bacteroidota bacterium]
MCIKKLERIVDELNSPELKNEAFDIIEIYENGVIEIEEFKETLLEICDQDDTETKKLISKVHLTSNMEDSEHWCETCTYAMINCDICEFIMQKLIDNCPDLTEEQKKELLSSCPKEYWQE